MISLNRVASMIAKREGKKSDARIGDIREILKLLYIIDGEMKFSGAVQDTPLWMLETKASEVCAKIKAKYLKKK